MMEIDFTGRSVLVTGATKGIGRATALLFAGLGATVTATYSRDETAAASLRGELGVAGPGAAPGDAAGLPGEPSGVRSHRVERCDLADHEGLRSLIARLEAEGRLPSVLVCNAAYQKKATVAETDIDLLEATFRANLFGNYVLCREVADRLAAHGADGVIIVNSSNQSQFVNPTGFAYALSKASLNHMVRHLARAYVAAGIRVNGLILGWFDTEGERAFYSKEQIARQAAANIPMGRAGDPAEAARMTAFLASPLASYATGSLVRLDGGFALAPDVST
jgi:NAD(P)-dependent dehydrogenase (short-subunit alcohol dehydrogenase family)